jgi:tetratricopeptide (TPR) repeat protein
LAETSELLAGYAVSLQGIVEIRRANHTAWEPVKPNDPFMVGDAVRIGVRSRADIALVNETILRLDQNTTIVFSGPEKGGFSILDLIKGALYFLTNRPRTLKIATPFVNGVVGGTEFYAMVGDVKTLFTIFKGRVSLSNDAGTLDIREGQSAITMANKAPEIHIVARPRDAVQWTLYYPPVLICTQTELLPAHPLDARAFTCKASELLTVGRIDEAQPDLERALSLSPGYGPALAMKSVVALVKNEKTIAMEIARKAVTVDPQSPCSWMALSYAQQGSHDLEGALKSVEHAVRTDPKDALARARLSDLWLSFGYLDKALTAAQDAEKINPHVSRNQTVLGFAYLAQIDTVQAKTAFEKAIALDQGDPLPRLGLGLSIIREGNLDRGRREIEIAASLDPQNSLIRSYLGKAYYEEKRDKSAREQYAMAKQFDPQDPTPYLYDAILKQSANKPVEALRDLERSIELNDQRAVYRSRLLLDEDVAVRQANIARIYSTLGFEQRALVEGMKSVNADPSNYSAHRFLADSYAARPRHEIARVSELLQSQLLQPININPVQPSLGLTDSLTPGGLGFANPSFSEHTALFNRNRFALLTSGIVGENGTWGEEVVHSGVWDKLSYSIGQLHYETNGFRKNADLKRNIYNFFGQVQATARTSLQIELQSDRLDRGDIEVRFFPEDVQPNLDWRDKNKTGRFGFRHNIHPGLDLIGNITYRNNDFSLNDHQPSQPPTATAVDTGQHGYIVEMQGLYRKSWFNIVGGFGYTNVESRIKDTTIFLDNPPIIYPISSKIDTRHWNAHVYGQINYPKRLVLTIGVSADTFKQESEKYNRINPKFGLTWMPIPSTTFRAAALKTFKRTLLTQQTLEPTQIAGFNQFYDDVEAMRAWLYGGAIDHKFSKSLFGGIEYMLRDTTHEGQVFFFDPPDPPRESLVDLNWKEYLTRTYLYWTPHTWFSLSGECLYEKFDYNRNITGVEEVRTYRVPLGLGFFHPSGISAKLAATYVHQKGDFRPQYRLMPWEPSISGNSSFWVIDASVSYRLPKRYGMVTVGAKNLFDKTFKYQDMDPFNPRMQFGRFFFARLGLSF